MEGKPRMIKEGRGELKGIQDEEDVRRKGRGGWKESWGIKGNWRRKEEEEKPTREKRKRSGVDEGGSIKDKRGKREEIKGE